jgi:hypothetical protein
MAVNINQLASEVKRSLSATQQQQLIAELQKPATNAASQPLESPDVLCEMLDNPEHNQPSKPDRHSTEHRMATSTNQPLEAPDALG